MLVRRRDVPLLLRRIWQQRQALASQGWLYFRRLPLAVLLPARHLHILPVRTFNIIDDIVIAHHMHAFQARDKESARLTASVNVQ